MKFQNINYSGIQSPFRSLFFSLQTLTQTNTTWKNIFLFLLTLTVCTSISFGQSQVVEQNFKPSLEKIGGIILTTVTQPDGKILLGGYLRFVDNGKRINIARLNSDRTLDTNFNPQGGANAAITSIAVQNDGKILVGGYFTKFNGINAGDIVRLNSDGSVDTTFDSTGTNSPYGIRAIAIQPNGKILIGGNFANYMGFSVQNLVRLNSNGTLDATFNPLATLTFGTVNDINVLQSGKIYFSVNFSQQSIPRSRLVRLNSDGSEDIVFGSTVWNGSIETIALQEDGKMLVGGTSSQGTFSISLIRYNDDGSLDTGFNTTSNGRVYKVIPEPDGKILIAGDFNTWNNQNQNRFARLNSNGSLDTSFGTNTQVNFSPRTAAKLIDGKFVIGGLEDQSTVSRNPLTLQDTDGNTDNSFSTKIKLNHSSDIVAVQPDGKILVAGGFTFVNGENRNGFARLNQNGTLDDMFNVNLDKSVKSIAIQSDGKILIGGEFEIVNSTARKGIARLHSDGTIDSTFNPGVGIGGGFNFPPYVSKIVTLASGKILVGGTFTRYNDFESKRLVRLNSDGSRDTTFNIGGGIEGGSEIVDAIVSQPDGKILIGGSFVFIDGLRRNGLIRLNSNGSRDTSFLDVGLTNSVFAVALTPDGKILIGGIFESLNGVESKHIARLNSNGSLDSSFNIGSGFSGGQSFAYVEEILLQPDGKLLVAGNFTGYNGTISNYLTRLNSDGSSDINFNIGTGANNRINSLIVQSNGKILIGGLFSEIDGDFRTGVARLSLNRQSSSFDFDGDGKTDISIFRPSVGEWYYQRSSNSVVNGAQFGSSTDKPAPADFTGDGKTDIAFFRPSSGEWFILRSEDFSFYAFPFGVSTDVPTVGDFDGDGKADQAVFRPSNGVWYINKSSGGVAITTFGTNGDRPVQADYDGDGKTDVAIYRPSVGEWYYLRSSDSQVRGAQFGSSTDKTVQGDYTGDGKADFAFFRPSTGNWFVLRSEDSSFFASPFGVSTDTPTIGDYDGDGKFDQAVFRPSNGVWYVNRSTAGVQIQQFGTGTDLPVPSYYLP